MIGGAAAQSWKNAPPESWRANAQITGARGGIAVIVTIQIDRYTNDADRDAIASALNEGGYAAFLDAFRKAPIVGAVSVGERSIPIRWARERVEGNLRHIAVVTDGPIHFAGAGALDAKPTAGFDLAVLDFKVDSVGMGSGTMAAAARVKPGGATGVQVDEYAGKPFTLVSVTKNMSEPK